jgi:release factor glutamine methyltransferase
VAERAERSGAQRPGGAAAKSGDAETELPPHEARWIRESVEGATTPLAEAKVARMVERRLAGEPLQYVLGSWAFRTLDLFVDPRVLIPRPETEVVAGYALAEADRLRAGREARLRAGGETVRVADLGTGSGAIGLAVAAERPWTEVWLTDVDADALAVARANLAGVGRVGTRVTVAEGAWFDALPDGARFDVVVSNPPYVAADEVLPPEVADWEPASALVSGPTGREALEHLVVEAPRWLAPGGALVLELAPHQADALRGHAAALDYADAEVHPDLAGRDRVLVCRVR